MNTQEVFLPFDVELLPVKNVTAGDLNCLYENGNLRYIKWGDVEIIRMIYGAVRDEHWATAPYSIQDEVIEEKNNCFSIRYTAIYQWKSIHYKATFQIEGRDNSISFSMQGEALRSFHRNRIGICVLHPLSCAGKNVEVQHWDGTSEKSIFPELISPHQPFKDIQQLRWEIDDQVSGILIVEGDIFETEDQRNWTDSSYKTYSTPLALPHPVLVKKGDTIQQKVVLKVEGVVQKNTSTLSSQYEEKLSFPKIGYDRYPHHLLNENEIQLLHHIPFDHYRVELKMKHSHWQRQFADAIEEAKGLHTKLELVIFFSTDQEKEIRLLMAAIKNDYTLIESILPLQEQHHITPPALLQFIYPILKNAYPDIRIGYGTDGFFAELNRNRPEGLDYDFVSFSLNPQVHADDSRTLIENLEAQKDTVTTLRSFIGNKHIHVSPVTFKIRHHDASHIQDAGNEHMQPDYDVRQHTAFGAWWTLQTIKNLSGVERITFYQTKGYKGVLKSFKGNSSTVNLTEEEQYPLYKVLAQIKSFAPKWIINKGKYGSILHEAIELENEQGDRLKFIIEEK
ncbi:MAG: hypothetical protein ICV81_11045 [Flavisolibacter sp.]|nr:hypothetical protein [Flavisolibacter sp.]